MTTHADTHRGAAFVLAWALMASPLALAADTNEALAKLAVAQARKLQNAEQYEKIPYEEQMMDRIKSGRDHLKRVVEELLMDYEG